MDNFITVISKVANPSTLADVAYIVRLVGGEVQFQACSSFVQGVEYYLVRQRGSLSAFDDGFGEAGGQIKRLVTGLIGGIVSENFTIPSMVGVAFGDSVLIKSALDASGVHALYSQVVTEFGYDLKTLSQLTNKFGGISMATVMLTGIVALGDARYHHRAVVSDTLTDQQCIDMMEALASKSEGKLISIMKSIKYDDSNIPAGDADPEYRIHLLLKFPKQTKVLEVPAVSTFDSNDFAAWFTANSTKIFDEHGDNPTALIVPTPKPERKARGR